MLSSLYDTKDSTSNPQPRNIRGSLTPYWHLQTGKHFWNTGCPLLNLPKVQQIHTDFWASGCLPFPLEPRVIRSSLFLIVMGWKQATPGSGCPQGMPQNPLQAVSTSAFRDGTVAMSVVRGHSQSPSRLVKMLLKAVTPCCGHCSSQVQSRSLWMTNDIRTSCRKITCWERKYL